MIVLEQPSEPFLTLDRAVTSSALAWSRKEQDIALALVWALCMIVGHILCERMLQGALPKQDQPRQSFVLDGAHPSFRVGVQIGAPRRQRDPRHSRHIDLPTLQMDEEQDILGHQPTPRPDLCREEVGGGDGLPMCGKNVRHDVERSGTGLIP